MKRLALLLPATLATGLLLAPAAVAGELEPLSGEGLYGAATDKVVTTAGFIVIAFFPLFILTMSLIQWRLEKRKEAKKAAAKRLKASAGDHWQAGW